mmetsp:Transcript_3928/g.11511  ORF Transcript_3928/g.11511 Transcript_3928/m.11511 type:complete len:421 (-) Transcript_3928:695-1957(-)
MICRATDLKSSISSCWLASCMTCGGITRGARNSGSAAADAPPAVDGDSTSIGSSRAAGPPPTLPSLRWPPGSGSRPPPSALMESLRGQLHGRRGRSVMPACLEASSTTLLKLPPAAAGGNPGFRRVPLLVGVHEFDDEAVLVGAVKGWCTERSMEPRASSSPAASRRTRALGWWRGSMSMRPGDSGVAGDVSPEDCSLSYGVRVEANPAGRNFSASPDCREWSAVSSCPRTPTSMSSTSRAQPWIEAMVPASRVAASRPSAKTRGFFFSRVSDVWGDGAGDSSRDSSPWAAAAPRPSPLAPVRPGISAAVEAGVEARGLRRRRLESQCRDRLFFGGTPDDPQTSGIDAEVLSRPPGRVAWGSGNADALAGGTGGRRGSPPRPLCASAPETRRRPPDAVLLPRVAMPPLACSESSRLDLVT